MRNDDDTDLGLSAMMARNVTATTSRPARGRESGSAKDGGGSRSRSRSSSVRRKSKSKKKDSAPSTPRRDRSRDAYGDDDKSVSSRKSMKSTRSRSKKPSRKKSMTSSRPSQTKPSSPEITSPNSGSTGSKEDRKKTKKKSRKIRRIKKGSGDGNESGDDEYTIVSKQSTRSTRSSKSSDSLRSKKSRLKNPKNRASKQYNETSSRVEAIREPILSNEGVVIKDEMDNLFPLPTSPVRNERKAVRRSSIGRTSLTDSDAKSSTGNYGIMSNKAAAEQAEAALNRVAAQQQMDMNNSNSGGSETSGRERQYRRFSNGSTRSKEQYQRLHRDSGLTSLVSVTDNDDDARSFGSRRSNTNATAMSALHKRVDEYKAESEVLQKRLYEALAEVEQCNKDLRREKERAETTEGDLSNVKSALETLEEEKAFLIESVRDMETEFVAKDERVEKLQEVVETQLDTVEFLEDKLNKSEEELVLMEEEITELLDVVEEKNKSNEQINEVKSKGQGRVARMVSMREGMNERRDAIKMRKEESRRVLISNEDQPESADRPRMKSMKSMMAPVSENQDDIEKLKEELKAQENKLKADRKECDSREQRLDTWERELFDLEDELKKESEKISAATAEAESKNSENVSVIASLEEQKNRLRRMSIEKQSKLKALEIENDDLRIKLDRVTKMATQNTKELPLKNNDLADARALVDEKDKIIQSLEMEIKKLGGKGVSNLIEEEGKDLLIRELQNQLVNAKKEASSLSSGNYVTRLKVEIKKLRETVKFLKNSVKEEEAKSRSNLQKKDNSMKLLEKQMQKLKIELERREKREKNLGTDQSISNSDLQNHIEDLEDEISHWKSTNADLENELESLKANGHDQHEYYLSEDDMEDDDCSIGSLASVNSKMSFDDNFFLSESNHSVSSAFEDVTTPSRAVRAVTNLWSKMRNGPEPPNANPGFPYAPGSLDD